MNSERFFASLDQLHAMLRWIRKETASIGFDRTIFSKIELACEEILVNIIHYAYHDQGGEIEIQVELIPKKQVRISFVDRGAPFDPLTVKKAICSTSLAEPEIGGVGISLIHKCVDEFFYQRIEEVNVLTLVKYY
jgi:anti-sigma regulatory factor (Ser/Thr protein kinase)